MAENSPAKRPSAMNQPKSPSYHPYGRIGLVKGKIKSPCKIIKGRDALATIPLQSRPLSLAHMSEGNFFSFSDGSASLFPTVEQTQHHRTAMSELSNILKQPIGNNKVVQKSSTGAVGIIGSRRPVGFIPVQSSFTIGGESGLLGPSNVITNKSTVSKKPSDGFQRSTSFTYVPTGTLPLKLMNDNKDCLQPKIGGIQWPIYNKEKIVHAKTFYPPAATVTTTSGVDSFSIYEDELDQSFVDKEKVHNFATSRNNSIADASCLGSNNVSQHRIPLSDISGASSIFEVDEIMSPAMLNDSGISAMEEGCQYGLGLLNSNNSFIVPAEKSMHEKVGQTSNIGRKSYESPFIEECGAADDENSSSCNSSSNINSPDILLATIEKPRVSVSDRFNCSFNSSFNDNFTECLGISSFDCQENKGVLTERKSPFYDFPEYIVDILSYWTDFEKKVRPLQKYMDKQTDISQRMRTILIDWLVEVGTEYDMQEETLYLSVSFIDRFLSKMAVSRNKLQLIGTAALFIASKYEEINPPDIKDFVYITDETYTKEQVVRMETIMLNVLNFDLMAPTAYDFVKAYSSLLQVSSQCTSLAMYLSELSLMDGARYLHYLPSLIATAAVGVARYSIEGIFFDDQFNSLTLKTHRLRDVQRCAQHLYKSFYEAPTLPQTAVFEKYKSVRFSSIALHILPIKLPWMC